MRGVRGILTGLAVLAMGQAQEADLVLTDAVADRFAALALTCVRREYPNKLDHVMNGAAEVKPPKALHPAFYGCFDWHSSVHGHWMLVKLLREHPGMVRAVEIRAVLDENLSPDRIAAEVAYLGQGNRKSFERTYGWAWLLKLSAELRSWDDPAAARWAQALQPLADELVAQFKTGEGYGILLPKSSPNTTKINDLLKAMTADGSLARFSSKYVQVSPADVAKIPFITP